jgi:hypothetical protein
MQVTIHGASLFPEDDVVNTWHFFTNDPTGPDVAAEAFWFDLQTFYGALQPFYSSQTVVPGFDAAAYDLSLPKPASPVWEGTTTGHVQNDDAAPRELAMCFSYHSLYEPGQPNARRRGRVYLGPFCQENLVARGGDVRLSDALTIKCRAAGLALATAAHDSALYKWVVYSPTDDLADGTRGNQPPREVIAGWVDNAVDIQRRRGTVADLRRAFEVGQP